MVAGSKKCSKCGLDKPRAEFSKCSSNPDGLQYPCKKCQSEAHAKYRNQPNYRAKATVLARIWRQNHPEKQRVAGAKYRTAHPERVKAAKKRWATERYDVKYAAECRWAKENPDKKRAQGQRQYQKYRDKIRARHAAWEKANPLKCALRRHRRRARLHAANGFATETQVIARIEYYGELCYLCGKKWEAIDHVIPLARGGTNWPANLRPICKSCNSRKGTKKPDSLCPN